MKYRSSSLAGDGITMAVAAGAATLRKNAYVMGTADSLEVEKLSVRGTVGEVEQDENGKYKPETYKLDQIRVPLFIAQGFDDPRVPPGESEMVYSVLRGLGRPVEYVRIPHEGHGFARIENRRTVFGGVARFLREHL